MTVNAEQWHALRSNILEQVEATSIGLYEEALALKGGYYEEFKIYSKKHNFKDRGRLILRVRDRKGSVAITWGLRWWDTNGGTRSKDLVRGKGYYYDGQLLKGQGVPGWEWDLFDQYEPLFAQIRQQTTYLGKVKRNVKRYIQLDESQSTEETEETEVDELEEVEA